MIDVVVSAELLCLADVPDGRPELAASYIRRHMLAVEMNR